MQAKASGHQALVERIEGAVVLCDGLDGSQPLHMDHLSSTQEKTDPLLQPVCLLLQAAIAGHLLKQLDTHRTRRGQKTEGHRTCDSRNTAAALLWSTDDEHPWFPA